MWKRNLQRSRAYSGQQHNLTYRNYGFHRSDWHYRYHWCHRSNRDYGINWHYGNDRQHRNNRSNWRYRQYRSNGSYRQNRIDGQYRQHWYNGIYRNDGQHRFYGSYRPYGSSGTLAEPHRNYWNNLTDPWQGWHSSNLSFEDCASKWHEAPRHQSWTSHEL
jgi:hypothetical protein